MVRLGQANLQTVELARRHCLNMRFVESGGRGAVEAQTGLPVNRRQIKCPVAIGNGMAMNLDGLASDFYAEHCVGCGQRRPTGEVPNLATVIEKRQRDAAAAADEEQRRTALQHEQWADRAERRRALAGTADEAMTGALADIGVLDTEPDADIDVTQREAAQRRLAALAERAPSLFTDDVVALAVSLVNDTEVTDLLDPLRHLARARAEFGRGVAAAAVAALRRAPVIATGRCVADLAVHVNTVDVDEKVVRSLVVLAGAPAKDRFGRWTRRSNANDPTGLRAVADLAPELVVRVLYDMLPAPTQPPGLVLPAGAAPRLLPAVDLDRASAAGAIGALATTHRNLAARLIPPLILDLAIEAHDSDNDYATVAIQRALATLLVLGIGDVVAEAEAAGRAAGDDLREPLFGVVQRVARPGR